MSDTQPGMFQPSEHTATPAFRIPAVDPAPVPAPATPIPPAAVDDVVFRQIQIMQAAGWQLERAWPGGADFVSRKDSGWSGGVHLFLCIFTLGLWIPFMILIEMGASGVKRTRLTVDAHGQPQYDVEQAQKKAKADGVG